MGERDSVQKKTCDGINATGLECGLGRDLGKEHAAGEVRMFARNHNYTQPVEIQSAKKFEFICAR